MQRWGLALALAFLLAGCSHAPAAPGPTHAPAPAFDPTDPRVPHDAAGAPAIPAGASLADPGFPVFGPAVRMNQTYRGARETSLALGPAGSGVLFACDPSGVPNLPSAVPFIGSTGHSYYYLSKDNGSAFADLDVESTQLDPRTVAFEGGDCDTAVGPTGELWTADTWLGSLSVGESSDLGKTWRGTSLAATSPGVDRPWLAVDKSGALHLTYQDVQFGMPSAIWYTHVVASEGPLVFQPAVPVADASPDGAFTWTGNLVVSDDGSHLWSVYTRRTDPVGVAGDAESVWVARSTDSGLTWSSVKVSDRPHSASYLYPSLARDGAGVLHVVFAQATDKAHPIFHSVSKDDGKTWSEPAIVRDGVAAFSPWVAGNPSGPGAAIQWYGTPDPKPDLASNKTAWYTYWATATPGNGSAYDYRSGTTTTAPLYTGKQGETPEFNMVRLDAAGRMHLGLSIPVYNAKSKSSPWSAFYQVQVAGPLLADGLVAQPSR